MEVDEQMGQRTLLLERLEEDLMPDNLFKLHKALHWSDIDEACAILEYNPTDTILGYQNNWLALS